MAKRKHKHQTAKFSEAINKTLEYQAKGYKPKLLWDKMNDQYFVAVIWYPHSTLVNFYELIINKPLKHATKNVQATSAEATTWKVRRSSTPVKNTNVNMEAAIRIPNAPTARQNRISNMGHSV